MQTNLFTGGRQATLTDAQEAISNFLCCLYFIYEIKDNPSRDPRICQNLCHILQYTHDTKFKQWYMKKQNTQLWIPHILLMMAHNLIVSYVNLGKNMDSVKDYDNSTLYQYDQSAFKEPDSIFLFI